MTRMCTTDRTVEENPPAPNEHWPPVEKIVWRSGWRAALSHLHTATADGPVFSADGSLAVHRTDPELAEGLSEDCRRIPYPDHSTAFTCAEHYYEFWPCKAVRAAALLAAPAPADPEEDGQ